MKYITAIEAAKKWELSERSVRNYCAEGRVAGAILLGKTWMIPEDAAKPMRKPRKEVRDSLLDVLKREKRSAISGGIYHKTQIELTNSR